MRMERPLWAEQRPENWWDAAVEAVRGVLAKAGVSGRQVQGVGLSGQMHGLVILDDAGAVIRPSLIWCDQRSQAQVDAVNAALGRENVVRFTANPVLTGFTLPKLLWVRDNEPRNFERVRKMLLPKDYVRYKLTGEFASEVSDASGTAVFDVVNRRWSFEMMDGLGLDRSILPVCYESSEVSGRITPEIAALTGLAAGTPVVGGGGDQAASAVGNGIVEAGIVSCTLGTSGVVFAHMDKVAYDPAGRVHTFCHAVRDKWHVMGVTQGALRRSDRIGGPIPRRRARPLLAALPDGRAHAPSGRHRARRLDRRDRQKHARRSHPRGDRRGLLQPARLPRYRGKPGRNGELGARLRRRRAEPLLAAASGLHLQPARGDPRNAGGLGLRRRPAGAGRHG
jgi:hypothetical protein